MNLKNLRIKAKMTQEEVGKQLGITQCAYGNYELGKRSPKPEMLKKLAQIFDCTVDTLLEDGDDGTGTR